MALLTSAKTFTTLGEHMELLPRHQEAQRLP